MRNQMLILSLVFVLVCVPGCDKSESAADARKKEEGNRAISRVNLKEISQAAYSYLMEHDGVPAPSLAILVKEGLLEAKNLVSPMSGRGPLKTDENGVPTEPGDYIYLARCFTEEAEDEGAIMAYERLENYQGRLIGNGTLVLVHWGVTWLGTKEFQEALAKTEKRLAEHDKKSSQP